MLIAMKIAETMVASMKVISKTRADLSIYTQTQYMIYL
jgi:hypothetical protein